MQMGALQVYLPENVQTEIGQIGATLSASIAAITGKTTNISNDTRIFLNSVSLKLISSLLQEGVAYHSFNHHAYLLTNLGLVKRLEFSLYAYLNLFLFCSRLIFVWILVTVCLVHSS
ncbi:hypothetical protein Bca4012_064655 [Brassica carinata]|uniref:Uncharacterized protein n=1 Tax=Brassica carinata TaxID=52824 RepID=A0A8X8AX45_BRACI|nr:hypothetical protein Bca52824_017155 [Brassica carinata]